MMTALSKRPDVILDAIRRTPFATVPELQQITGYRYSEVKSTVHGLRKFDLIKSIRTGDHAKYVISNKGFARLDKSETRRIEAEEETIPRRTWEVADVIAKVPNSVFQLGDRA